MDSSLGSKLDLWREQFPALRRTLDGQRLVYLDNAASTLKPQPVIDAISHYYSTNGANIHRGAHLLGEEVSGQFERVRRRMAQWLGCFGDEVVFVRNTTEALNLVAQGLELDASADWVLSTLDAHHSLTLPWRRRCRTQTLSVDAHGFVDLNRYEELLRERPRVVALSHCSNVTGVYLPLERMAQMAKDTGATVVVDAAQSIPHRRLDVSRLPVDFLAFSGHKMLGPTGVGVLYGRRALLETLSPLMLGGGTVDWVDGERYELRKVPHRFEAGTPDIAAVLGLGAALAVLEQVGPELMAEHDAELGRALWAGSRQREYLRPLGPEEVADRAAILSFSLPGIENLSEVARMLSDGHGVMCRSGHLCAQPFVDAHRTGEVLRASAYLYNTPADIERFFTGLDEVRSALGI